jgi:hypothetical protein
MLDKVLGYLGRVGASASAITSSSARDERQALIQGQGQGQKPPLLSQRETSTKSSANAARIVTARDGSCPGGKGAVAVSELLGWGRKHLSHTHTHTQTQTNVPSIDGFLERMLSTQVSK